MECRYEWSVINFESLQGELVCCENGSDVRELDVYRTAVDWKSTVQADTHRAKMIFKAHGGSRL